MNDREGVIVMSWLAAVLAGLTVASFGGNGVQALCVGGLTLAVLMVAAMIRTTE